MTRHGKNQTASSVYSYEERRKDNKQSGYGTLAERLGKDSIKEFDCCSLTLQPCKDPVVTKDGIVYDKEAILTYILHHKRQNAKKTKEYAKQKLKEEEDRNDVAAAEHSERVAKFAAQEMTPAHPGTSKDEDAEILKVAAEQAGSVSNMSAGKDKQLPSFWLPSQMKEVPSKLQKPDQKVYCPCAGKPIKMSDLIPIIFTPIKDDNPEAKTIGKTMRYMCPVTFDALTNMTPCAALRTSLHHFHSFMRQIEHCRGHVVTMDCVDKVIRKDMLDPINGKEMKEADIIPLKRGGTGFALTNDGLDAKKHRAVMELQ